MTCVLNSTKFPRSLRAIQRLSADAFHRDGSAVTALGVVAFIASTAGTALAQTSLPTIDVNAPRERTHAAAKPKASASSTRLSSSGPRSGSGSANAPSVPVFVPAANADPYADPVAPYRAVRLQSNKFTQPIINTPRTVTVLTKEVLEDKNATNLREIGRSTAGVTLGTGEGGNAFGDRFFIRGFDARNDIFVDGVRDPGVSIRENFYTEQVEILRGPGSTFAGRGTAGGAINIVTKQASERDFTDLKFMGGFSDKTKRVTLDVNRAITPSLFVRLNAMYQDANVAGRSFITDNRNGVAGSVVYKPIEGLTLTAEYNHVYQRGLPDFGVAYNRIANRPVTEGLVPRYTWYGFLDRDFQVAQQDFGTFTAQYKVSDNITVSSKLRQGRSVLDYIGTIAEGANIFKGTVNLNPQSRNQVTDVLDNQTEAVAKFDTGPVNHAIVTGVEFSREYLTRDTYAGLKSELNVAAPVNGSVVGNLYLPPTYLPFSSQPYLTGNPTRISVDTKSGYVIETADYQNKVIANAGVRYDDYTITSRNETYTTFAYNHSGLVNYNAGLVVKPLPNVSVYAAYATSSNPVGAELDGTAANYGGLSAAAQIFPPQYNRAEEIGVKWQLFDHLLATGSLFRTSVTNAREVNSGVTTGNSAYYVQGVDLELAGNITDKWSAIGGLVLMESKVTSSYAPTNVGLQLANIAHQSFSMLSKYKLGDLLGVDPDVLEIGGQAVYRSKIYGGNNLVANGGTSFNALGLPAPTASNPFVNVPTELPSYWRFDVFTEAKIGPYATLKFSMMNLFNRTYYDAFYQSSAPFAQMAPGRAAYLEARLKF